MSKNLKNRRHWLDHSSGQFLNIHRKYSLRRAFSAFQHAEYCHFKHKCNEQLEVTRDMNSNFKKDYEKLRELSLRKENNVVLISEERDELQKRVWDLVEALNKKSKELDIANKNLDTASKKLETAEEKLQDAKDKLEEFDNDIESKEKEIKNLKNSLNDSKNNNMNNEKKIKNLETEVKNYKDILNDKEKENNINNKKMNDLLKKTIELENKIKDMEVETDRLLDVIDRNSKATEKLENKICEDKKVIDMLENDKLENKKTKSKLENHIIENEAAIDKLEDEKVENKKVIDKLNNQMVENKKAISKLENQILENNKVIDKLENQILENKKFIGKLEKQISDDESTIDNLENDIRQEQKIIKDNENEILKLKNMIKNLENKLNSLQNEMKEKDLDMKECEGRNSDINDKYKNLKNDYDKIVNERQYLSNNNSNLNAIVEKNEAALQAANSLTKELSKEKKKWLYRSVAIALSQTCTQRLLSAFQYWKYITYQKKHVQFIKNNRCKMILLLMQQSQSSNIIFAFSQWLKYSKHKQLNKIVNKIPTVRESAIDVTINRFTNQIRRLLLQWSFQTWQNWLDSRYRQRRSIDVTAALNQKSSSQSNRLIANGWITWRLLSRKQICALKQLKQSYFITIIILWRRVSLLQSFYLLKNNILLSLLEKSKILNNKVILVENSNKNLQDQNKELTQRVDSLLYNLSKEEELVQLKNIEKEKQWQRQQHDADSIIYKLNTEIKELKDLNNNIEDLNKKYIKDINDLETNLKDTQAELVQLQGKLNRCNDEISRLENRVYEKDDQYHTIQRLQQKLNNDINERDYKINSLQSDIDALHNKNTELLHDIISINGLNELEKEKNLEKIQSLNNRIQELTWELEREKEKNQWYVSENELEKQMKESLVSNIYSLRQERAELQLTDYRLSREIHLEKERRQQLNKTIDDLEKSLMEQRIARDTIQANADENLHELENKYDHLLRMKENHVIEATYKLDAAEQEASRIDSLMDRERERWKLEREEYSDDILNLNKNINNLKDKLRMEEVHRTLKEEKDRFELEKLNLISTFEHEKLLNSELMKEKDDCYNKLLETDHQTEILKRQLLQLQQHLDDTNNILGNEKHINQSLKQKMLLLEDDLNKSLESLNEKESLITNLNKTKEQEEGELLFDLQRNKGELHRLCDKNEKLENQIIECKKYQQCLENDLTKSQTLVVVTNLNHVIQLIKSKLVTWYYQSLSWGFYSFLKIILLKRYERSTICIKSTFCASLYIKQVYNNLTTNVSFCFQTWRHFYDTSKRLTAQYFIRHDKLKQFVMNWAQGRILSAWLHWKSYAAVMKTNKLHAHYKDSNKNTKEKIGAAMFSWRSRNALRHSLNFWRDRTTDVATSKIRWEAGCAAAEAMNERAKMALIQENSEIRNRMSVAENLIDRLKYSREVLAAIIMRRWTLQYVFGAFLVWKHVVFGIKLPKVTESKPRRSSANPNSNNDDDSASLLLLQQKYEKLKRRLKEKEKISYEIERLGHTVEDTLKVNVQLSTENARLVEELEQCNQKLNELTNKNSNNNNVGSVNRNRSLRPFSSSTGDSDVDTTDDDSSPIYIVTASDLPNVRQLKLSLARVKKRYNKLSKAFDAVLKRIEAVEALKSPMNKSTTNDGKGQDGANPSISSLLKDIYGFEKRQAALIIIRNNLCDALILKSQKQKVYRSFLGWYRKQSSSLPLPLPPSLEPPKLKRQVSFDRSVK